MQSVATLKYPSINSKIYGMYSKRIKKSDLKEILKQNSIKQASEVLKSVNSDFENLDEIPKRINLKVALDDSLISDILKIYRLLTKNDKEIFLEFISIYEIECIKSVFRKIFSKKIIENNFDEIKNWIEKIFNNLSGLDYLDDFDTFISIINRTEYKFIFEKCDRNLENVSLFQIENELDKYYFKKMMKISKSYNSNLADMIGKQIDLNNIIWIYRLKKNYKFEEIDLKNIIIDEEYKLNKNEIQQLILANNENEFIDILENTYYFKYINFKNLENIEWEKDKYLYKLYSKYFRGNIMDSTTIFAFIYMVEMENNDLINIFEGIRYDLPKEKIRDELVF